jgi:hypothetical protein
MKRFMCLLLTLISLLLSSACIGDSPAVARGEITAEDLPSIFPTEGEIAEILGVEFSREVRQDLGQEYEGIDIEKYGLVSGYVASYGPQDQEQGVLMSLGLFETPEGASGVFQDMLKGLEPETDQKFDLGDIGDEAQGLVHRTSPNEPSVASGLLRVDKLMVFIAFFTMGDSPAQDISPAVRELAAKAAMKIESLSNN